MIYSPFYLFPRQHVNEQALACCWGWPIDLSRERLDSLPPLFMLVHFSEGRERERERGMPRYGESDESSVERSLNVPSRESVLGSLWFPPPTQPLFSLALLLYRPRTKIQKLWARWVSRLCRPMRNRRKLYENSPAKIPNLLNCRFFTAYGGVAVVCASRDFFTVRYCC
jgi:hypothetical protein